MRKPIWHVVQDGEGWGVADVEGILENQEPMTQIQAINFCTALREAHEVEEANQRYWSQSCFGE